MSDSPTVTTTSTTATDLDDGDEVLDDLEFDEEDLATDDPLGPAPEVVVFDVGEVLVDETRVWATWAEIIGVSPLTLGAALGAAVAQGLDYPSALDHVAPNIVWQDFEAEHERRYGGFTEDDLYSDVRPCLEELRHAGIRVVLSGNQPARRADQLRALDLSCDALAMSEELGHDKPDPSFFGAVVDLAGAPTDHVLYVGDRIDNDVLPAAAAGLRTCWLRRGPWGILQDLPDGEDADLVLDGLGELPLLLAEWRGREEPSQDS